MRLPFAHGNHICAVYEDADQQREVAADYVFEGLTRNERCLYVAETPAALDHFREALAQRDARVAQREAEGALLLRTTDEAHLIDGRFDSERMIGMLNDALEDALNAGFAGLRTCGDMSWLLRDAPGSSQVIEYEGLLNQFFENSRALGMCQYDQRRLPLGLLDQALATHTSVVIDGRHGDNPFYRPWPFMAGESGQGGAFTSKVDQLRARP